MVVGSPVRVTGTVTPHPAGIQLTLQQRHGGGWLAIGDAQARPTGAFSFVARPQRVGIATYRVVTAQGTSFVGSSARVSVRVLHWVYVTSIPDFVYTVPTPGSGNLSTDPIVSNGVHYAHPISIDPGCYNQWGGNAWIDYILQRQYQVFAATVGLGDSAPAGSTATYTLIGAGKKLASGSLAVGSAKKLKVSVSGIYRLRVEVNVPDPTNAAGCGGSGSFTQVVFGDAELLGP